MPTLKEILADKANYQDNLAWNLGNGQTVTLGQMRSLSSEDQATLTKRDADLTKRQAELDKADAEVKKAQVNTANLYVGLQSALTAIKEGKFDTLSPEIKALFGNQAPTGSNNNNNPNDPFAALSRLENDTLLGPVVQAIKAVAAGNKKAEELVAQNVEVQKRMATNYLNGVLEDRYERLVPEAKKDSITLESLIKGAVAANQFSSDGSPNIRWAYKNATAADNAAAHDAEVAAAAVKKFQEEQAAKGGGGGASDPIFVGQPQNFGLDVHNRSGKAPQAYKNLDDAFAAAAKDKDIWSQVDSTLQ